MHLLDEIVGTEYFERRHGRGFDLVGGGYERR
jgi:hypothetical protein